jgi:hypothetical protein
MHVGTSGRATEQRATRRNPLWFVAWAFTGLLACAVLLGGFGILALAAPLALAAIVFMGVKALTWPEVMGFFVGPGVLFLLLARGASEIPPCPPGPIIVTPSTPNPGICGESLPVVPLLVTGFAFLTIGFGGYLVSRFSVGGTRRSGG